jgi:uncharacterized OsmC-like protein
VSTTTAREYEAQAQSTDTFGRVLCAVRTHHFIVDGPVQNGCPGEEVTPAEMFLAAIASCGVELIQAIARDRGVRVHRVGVEIRGTIDRTRQQRADVTVFNAVHLRFALAGPDRAEAGTLVEAFKGR